MKRYCRLAAVIIGAVLVYFALVPACSDDPESPDESGNGTHPGDTEYSWRRVDRFPTVRSLTDLAVFSADHVVAVGLRGTIVEYNAGEWRRMYDGKWTDLWGVWADSPDAVIAVGDGGLVLQWDGMAWSELPVVTENNLRGIWGSSPDSVYITGEDGTVLFYDKVSLTQMDTPGAAPIFGVWGTSGSNVFAVGTTGVWHYDGSAWNVMPVPSTELLSSVYGTGPHSVFAAGNQGTVLHYDGATWDLLPATGPNDVLYDVWAASDTCVFAVGRYALHLYDGNNWSAFSQESDDWFYGVAGTAEGQVVAVGAETVLRYDGVSWSRLNQGGITRLRDVCAVSDDDVFVVGDDGTILRYHEKYWVVMDSRTREDLVGVWAPAGDRAFAVGGTHFLYYDGSEWRRQTLFDTQGLLDAWGTTEHQVWVTCMEGDVYLYDEFDQIAKTYITSMPMNAIWGTAPDQIFGVCDGGSIYSYNGYTWRSMSTPVAHNLHAVWGFADDELPFGTHRLFAAGEEGILLEYNHEARRWVVVESGTLNHLYGMGHTEASRLFAVGEHGEMLAYSGYAWTRVSVDATEPLYGVHGLPSGMVYAVGGDELFGGVLLRYGPE